MASAKDGKTNFSLYIVSKLWNFFLTGVYVIWTGRPGVLRFMGSQRVGHD